jgi:CheY-like chemotaxis protein
VKPRRIRVIVVDDEPDMQIFLSTLLRENGLEPIVARDAAEGLEKARSMDPSCILLNAMIPDEEGSSMYVNLKCDEHLKTVPVIMFSSIAKKIMTQLKYFQRLPDGRPLPEPEAFLESPPDTEELLQEIHRLAREKTRG